MGEGHKCSAEAVSVPVTTISSLKVLELIYVNTKRRTDKRMAGQMAGQTDVEVEIVIRFYISLNSLNDQL